MKRKFLHIEIIDGQLYVYAADLPFDAKEYTREEIDNECKIDHNHIIFDIKKLANYKKKAKVVKNGKRKVRV